MSFVKYNIVYCLVLSILDPSKKRLFCGYPYIRIATRSGKTKKKDKNQVKSGVFEKVRKFDKF